MLNKINKKKTLGFLFIAFSALTLIWILFKNNDIAQIKSILQNINSGYISLAVLSIFIFWLLESFMIFVLIIKFTTKKKNFDTFWLSVKTTMIGQYYSNITPFASGGQPIQLYVMKDDNVPVSSATAVLVSKFLLFQVGVTIYSLALASYRIKMLLSYVNGISVFVFTGLTLNIVMLSIIILISFKPKMLLTFAEMIFEFLHNRHMLKDLNGMINKTHDFISEYEASITKLKQNKILTLKLFLITFIQLTVFFSITFFIYKSLNLTGSSIFEIICLQSFLYMAVSFIPTPGTAGVSEVGFILILGNVFSGNIASTALILWRGISYYFSLVFSGIFSLIVTTLAKKKVAAPINGSNYA